MKVAHLITNLKLGGPCKVMTENIKHLPSDVESTIYYCKELEGFSNELNAKKLDFSSFNELAKYDVIHSHGLRPDGIAALSAILHRRPVHVSTIHNYFREELYNIYGARAARWVPPVWVKAWRKMDGLAVLTQDAKAYYSEIFPSEKLHVVGNGMDLSFSDKNIKSEDLEKISELKSKFKIIGSNSHIIKRKGLDQVIRALVDLPDYALVVVGEGPYRAELQTLAESLSVADRCIFFGFKRNAINFTSYYDLYIMASHNEGFGLALIEGMACGVPCVCSDIATFREILTSDAGVFFKLNDIPSLVASIKEAYQHRSALGIKGEELYQQRYTGRAMADKYYRLYRDLMEKRRA